MSTVACWAVIGDKPLQDAPNPTRLAASVGGTATEDSFVITGAAYCASRTAHQQAPWKVDHFHRLTTPASLQDQHTLLDMYRPDEARDE
jgi:hypothetical protein